MGNKGHFTDYYFQDLIELMANYDVNLLGASTVFIIFLFYNSKYLSDWNKLDDSSISENDSAIDRILSRGSKTNLNNSLDSQIQSSNNNNDNGMESDESQINKNDWLKPQFESPNHYSSEGDELMSEENNEFKLNYKEYILENNLNESSYEDYALDNNSFNLFNNQNNLEIDSEINLQNDLEVNSSKSFNEQNDIENDIRSNLSESTDELIDLLDLNQLCNLSSNFKVNNWIVRIARQLDFFKEYPNYRSRFLNISDDEEILINSFKNDDDLLTEEGLQIINDMKEELCKNAFGNGIEPLETILNVIDLFLM